MRAELLQLAADLARKGVPFVLATVVRREPYSSAQPGDMAVITADGTCHGWLGGSCTQPTVKIHARQALADGQPRLIALLPEPSREKRPGVLAVPMTCHSGGSVDIYLEPVLPAPRLLLFGHTPTARALVQLGKAMGYRVDLVHAEADAASLPQADRVLTDLHAPELRSQPGTGERVYAVVANMGEADEDSLAAALACRPAWIGVVASRKRYAEIRAALLARGVAEEALASVRNPAGLDIGARRPEEIALSVLAEIVKCAREADAKERAPAPVAAPAQGAEAIDPVCGMTVAVGTARHKAEHAGRTWFFCNPRCREKFLADPQRWLQQAHQGVR
jgi:xanthine dehydrogenase accessory factor